jgi:hypothetical protein
VQIHVGHFLVRARQLTSQAKEKDTNIVLIKDAERELSRPYLFEMKATDSITTASAFPEKEFVEISLPTQLYSRAWVWKFCGAAFGLLGGICCGLIGSAFTATTWFIGWHAFGFHRAGTVFLFMTIPLLLFGAHCLDLLDSNTKIKDSNEKGEYDDVGSNQESGRASRNKG